jgi:two-component system LytT family response regulator
VSIRVLIIDDEKPAREKIKLMLHDHTDLYLAGESANGGEAVDHIRLLKPDLIFLDIQMPVLDGFGVLETIESDQLPVIIFVTAFDRYAMQAFEVNAIDYLLKPFDEDRFNKALQKARQFLQPQYKEELQKQMMSLLEKVTPMRPYRDRMIIKTGDGFLLIRTGDIDWIEAAENYVNVHAGKETHLIRKTMRETEKQLDPEKFIRIHRSTIVNIEKIKYAKRWFNGEYQITLLNGTVLTSSRGYSDRIQCLFDSSP